LSFKKNIINTLLLALWIALGSSVLVLLVAAINIKDHKLCKGVEIEITGVKEIFFLDKNDISMIVSGEGIARPAGIAVTRFNLQRLESVLEKNVWVKDAELFFDNNLLLHINILEREPVARVFTNSGNSFYIDSSCSIMPLNSKMNVRLPVFTGFPDNRKQSQTDDSVLVKHIRNLTMYILNDKFWLAQIAQVDINADNNFVMIPTVGSHTIEFGNGDNYERKFRRLLSFYQQVLSHTGIDTYTKISVKYDKQVIGTKKGIITKIDSVRALINIRKMIEEAKRISEDSAYVLPDKTMVTAPAPDSMIMDAIIDKENEVQKFPLKNNSAVLKPGSLKNNPVNGMKQLKKTAIKQAISKPLNRPVSQPDGMGQKPKALMSKRVIN